MNFTTPEYRKTWARLIAEYCDANSLNTLSTLSRSDHNAMQSVWRRKYDKHIQHKNVNYYLADTNWKEVFAKSFNNSHQQASQRTKRFYYAIVEEDINALEDFKFSDIDNDMANLTIRSEPIVRDFIYQLLDKHAYDSIFVVKSSAWNETRLYWALRLYQPRNVIIPLLELLLSTAPDTTQIINLALGVAIEMHQHDIVKYLLKCHKVILWDNVLLEAAITFNNEHAFDLLLASGINVHVTTETGACMLDVALNVNAASIANTNIIIKLLNLGAFDIGTLYKVFKAYKVPTAEAMLRIKPQLIREHYKSQSVYEMFIVTSRPSDTVMSQHMYNLIKEHNVINYVHPDNAIRIMQLAAQYAASSVLQDVINHFKIDFNARDDNGYSALHYAVLGKNHHNILYLINCYRAADPDFDLNQLITRDGRSLLHMAVSNSLYIMKLLIESYKIKINNPYLTHEPFQNSPLAMAIMENYNSCVDLLLLNGAKLNANTWRHALTYNNLHVVARHLNTGYRALSIRHNTARDNLYENLLAYILKLENEIEDHSHTSQISRMFRIHARPPLLKKDAAVTLLKVALDIDSEDSLHEYHYVYAKGTLIKLYRDYHRIMRDESMPVASTPNLYIDPPRQGGLLP